MNLCNVYWLNGGVLKILLHERKKTMKKLSEETGLSYSSIKQWANHAFHISLENASVLAKYLQVSVEDLITLDLKANKNFETTKDNIHKGVIDCNTIMINRIIRCKKTNDIEVILDTLFRSHSILNQTSFLSETEVKKFIKEHNDEIRWYEE